MGKVIFDISISLDGFITASNRSAAEPMGAGGEKLHEWAFNSADARNREILTQGAAGTGAVIAGRRTYDDSIPWWGPDGPTGPIRLPVFVVTHTVPDQSPDGGVYTFVTGGIQSALQQAKNAAGDKNVTVMGGASLGQQYLEAGLLDEISLHLVPVLFGGGIPLFVDHSEKQLQLEPVQVIETREAVHLRYRVKK